MQEQQDGNHFFGFLRNLQLTITEKIIFSLLIIGFLSAFVFTFAIIYKTNTNKVPANGGTLKEVIIGTPRFINPLLATTNTDKDLSALVYAGLFKKDINGHIEKELAQDIQISEDGKKYTIKLKNNIKFHDGSPITADDIVYTINMAKDPLVKSNLQSIWDGVQVQKIDERTVEFILSEPFSDFKGALTIGILPKNKWRNVSPESFSLHKLNLQPIGAGPYKVQKITYKKDGIPYSIILKSNKNYVLGAPYINEFEIFFAKNKEEEKQIANLEQVNLIPAIQPESIKEFSKNYEIKTSNTNRIFYLFLNQTKNPNLANINLRKAIYNIIDREKITNNVFLGFAQPKYNLIPQKQEKEHHKLTREEIESLLKKAGYTFSTTTKTWTKDEKELQINIVTATTPDLTKVAEEIKMQLQRFGIKSDLHVFELNQLTQNIIRPREYESILFGQVVKNLSDFYAFWHSSQREDPGINIAMYANPKLDKILEELKTKNMNKEQTQEKINEINKILKNDMAAIPIYSPKFLYAVKKDVQVFIPDTISISADRFANIHKWYINTQRVWNFLTK